MIPLWLVRWGIGAAVGVLIGIATHHHGVVSGKASRDAYWQPLFAAAEKAAAEANAKTASIERASDAHKLELEKRLEQITVDATAAQRGSGERISGLLRQLASRPRSCPVPEVAGDSQGDDGPAESDGRFAASGASLARVAADCRHDAELLGLWQEFWRRESALRR